MYRLLEKSLVIRKILLFLWEIKKLHILVVIIKLILEILLTYWNANSEVSSSFTLSVANKEQKRNGNGIPPQSLYLSNGVHEPPKSTQEY